MELPCTLDISIYLSDIKDLFHLPTQGEYNDALKEMAGKWSAPFYHYYQQHIHTDINSIAISHLAYITYLTSNQAESLNCVLKCLSDWQEAPVDCMVLALYYLQSYYQMEIYRGKPARTRMLPSFHYLFECEPSFVLDEHVCNTENESKVT